MPHFLQGKPWNWMSDVSLQKDWYHCYFLKIQECVAGTGSFTYFSSSCCFSCLKLLVTQNRKYPKLYSVGWNTFVSSGIYEILSPTYVMLGCPWFNKVELWSKGFSWGWGIHYLSLPCEFTGIDEPSSSTSLSVPAGIWDFLFYPASSFPQNCRNLLPQIAPEASVDAQQIHKSLHGDWWSARHGELNGAGLKREACG